MTGVVMACKDLPVVAMRAALDSKLAGSISAAWTGLNDRWTRRAKDDEHVWERIGHCDPHQRFQMQPRRLEFTD